MIELVSRAEDWLAQRGALAAEARGAYSPADHELVQLADLRREAAGLYGAPVLVQWDCSPLACGFAQRAGAGDLVSGPLTPDHSLHCKAFGASLEDDGIGGLGKFAERYRQYFADHAQAQHQCLDPMPRYGVWQGRGMVYFAPSLQRLEVVRDITCHTLRAIQWAEALGGWQPLTHTELFEVEYWELEQAKLKSPARSPAFQGKVAVVSGAASGIGRATVETLASRGCAVVALDIHPDLPRVFEHSPGVLSLHCDVTNADAIASALGRAVMAFGGVDILVSNAGSFPASMGLAEMTDQAWQSAMAVNLDSHMKLLRAAIPFLSRGLDPAVVIIASKNVPAPGPGAGAYSAAKAGLTQLARVAALELGAAGIRVNVLHPNAVFDTGLWSDAIIQERAARYGMSADQYRRNNLLRTEVTAVDVARMVCVFAGADALKTTGAQVPVDGGNERVV